MRRGRSVIGALVVSAAVVSAVAAQPADLPAGPNRDLVSRTCQTCHDLSMIIGAAGQTREGWNATIEEMIGYGLRVDREERGKILDYLATYLGSR